MHFLWLASHKRLLTNEERGRRHLTNQVNCSRCAVAVESFEHVIFDWQTRLIAWQPGDEGWFTLNTDGSRITQSGATAIGGIIRDSGGTLVRAFSANVGNCSITRAELRAVVEGLKIAWSLGIRKVTIQSDSAAAVAMLQAGGNPTHRHAALVAEFQALRARQWEVSIAHIFREANCCADYLANLGHSLWFGLHVFDYPVSLLADWLRYDLVGVALPRVVSCNN
ncbi:Putative ribonuclease H protein At1g65750 [Linum perenne]